MAEQNKAVTLTPERIEACRQALRHISDFMSYCDSRPRQQLQHDLDALDEDDVEAREGVFYDSLYYDMDVLWSIVQGREPITLAEYEQE